MIVSLFYFIGYFLCFSRNFTWFWFIFLVWFSACKKCRRDVLTLVKKDSGIPGMPAVPPVNLGSDLANKQGNVDNLANGKNTIPNMSNNRGSYNGLDNQPKTNSTLPKKHGTKHPQSYPNSKTTGGIGGKGNTGGVIPGKNNSGFPSNPGLDKALNTMSGLGNKNSDNANSSKETDDELARHGVNRNQVDPAGILGSDGVEFKSNPLRFITGRFKQTSHDNFKKVEHGVDSLAKKFGKHLSKKALKQATIATILGGGTSVVLLGSWLLSGDTFNVKRYINDLEDEICATLNDSNATSFLDDDGSSASMGDWSDPNSTTYKNGKQLFDFLVQKQGFSGAAAAGVVGSTKQESGLDPAAHNPSGEVIGLMQWGYGGINGGRLYNGGIIPKPYSASDLTMDKELALVDWEINNSYRQYKVKIGSETDPTQAALDWARYYEGAPGQRDDLRAAYARTAYNLYHADGIEANTALLGAESGINGFGNSALAQLANNLNCGTSGVNADTGSVLSTAESLVSYLRGSGFTYSQPMRTDFVDGTTLKDISKVDQVKKTGHADCSSFVWLVVKLTGKKVPDTPWITGTMVADASGPKKYLVEIPESEAKAGDIVVTDGSGNDHTAVLAEDYHGTATNIINEGGSNDGPPHKEPIANSFGVYFTHVHFVRVK
ncbi:phage tail tip lysozyme [Ligilactobacillus agilis]|uniref:phage tail tip lysozyme n=1 Tax=Ligilactobacillus agilis TaxID=1601 RepID=UPI0025A3DBE2|nr:phage tail tip lysozyme [Ligilactobacillus agilis]MDM8279150.1 phage tail tip lysozyme [Ligilactobacillus agilis]